MGGRRHGESFTRKTTSQMQTRWRSPASLPSLSTGEQQTYKALLNTFTGSHISVRTFSSLHKSHSSAVLQYRKAQVKFDKSHRHTERQFHLRLFCLSAPSQLQHADPYYPPANWLEERGGGSKRHKEAEGKGMLMRKLERQQKALNYRTSGE